jgi:plastocyanin
MTAIHEATRSRVSWKHVLRVASLADLFVIAVVGLAFRDSEALGFAGVILVGLILLRIRSGLAGVVMLGVLLLDAAVFMLPAAASNVVHRGSVRGVLIPISLAVISLAGAAAAVGSLFRHSRPEGESRAAPIVAQAAMAVLVVSIIAGVAAQRSAKEIIALPSDLRVTMRTVSFEPESLRARIGSVGVAVVNHDLFWHTFTIDRLHINVDVPTGGLRRITFDASPGSYEFYCRVPGHRAAGMHGTLTVG